MMCAILMILLILSTNAFAGDLEPAAVPDNATSAMYTLEDIYNYLDTGMPGTKRPGGAQEPTSTASTGHTLDEVHEKVAEKCFETCEGTLNGTRWCDQEDGTVKDMTTGLVWLKNASCYIEKGWARSMLQTSILKDGLEGNDCGLSDESEVGDWRLPTDNELVGLNRGTEPVSSSVMRAFTGSISDFIWTGTVSFGGYYEPYVSKVTTESDFNWFHVVEDAVDEPGSVMAGAWPVRSDN